MPSSPADVSSTAVQEGLHVAVVIPCFNATDVVLKVISAIGPSIRSVICVDDACPNRSGRLIEERVHDGRVQVVFHEENLGVGGATMTGFRVALQAGADVVVKIDADGQMDPSLIPLFVKPIREGRADYTKGNRFYDPEGVRAMPLIRLFGNTALSFFSKLSSGYWNLFDPTNGYVAIHSNVLRRIPLDKLSNDYFFESDMLFRLNIMRAVVLDIPMQALYGTETSGLRVGRIVPRFVYKHIVNFMKRVFYSYFLRDFNIASLELLTGAILVIGGASLGIGAWIESAATGQFTSAGTVMLAALPILVGLQLVLGFLNYDIQSVPSQPIHSLLS